MNPLQAHDRSLLQEGAGRLIGVDEAGRGCLAGAGFSSGMPD